MHAHIQTAKHEINESFGNFHGSLESALMKKQGSAISTHILSRQPCTKAFFSRGGDNPVSMSDAIVSRLWPDSAFGGH